MQFISFNNCFDLGPGMSVLTQGEVGSPGTKLHEEREITNRRQIYN